MHDLNCTVFGEVLRHHDTKGSFSTAIRCEMTVKGLGITCSYQSPTTLNLRIQFIDSKFPIRFVHTCTYKMFVYIKLFWGGGHNSARNTVLRRFIVPGGIVLFLQNVMLRT